MVQSHCGDHPNPQGLQQERTCLQKLTQGIFNLPTADSVPFCQFLSHAFHIPKVTLLGIGRQWMSLLCIACSNNFCRFAGQNNKAMHESEDA